ncbi:MAG: DNA adenine methylase [Candidatus Dojkabacteria bacterium]|nr:DNA adenine methylase [Candidatus Dojkabacteria bacterium]
MDSVLSWIGGKSQSAKRIVSLMSEHGCYCEVFFGAGWIFFEKKPSKDEVINDINSELINFYRVIQRDCDKFKAREKYEMYSRELYYEYLQDFYSGKHKSLDNVEKAFRFFYLIKAAFASKFGSGFAFGSNRQSSVAFFNQFKELDGITKRLKNATIDNRDFEDVIKSYDSERTLFMCDPPYMKSDNSDYYFKSANASFGLHEHQRLFMALRSIKGKFILTVDDTSWVRERYCTGEPVILENKVHYSEDSGFYWLDNEVYYCSADADNRRHEVELIIMNYNPNNIKKHTDINQTKLQF